MTRLAGLLALAALAALGFAAPASAAFGIAAFDSSVRDSAGQTYSQAGGRPYEIVTRVAVNSHEDPAFPNLSVPGTFFRVPDASVKDIVVDLPAGFVGNPRAVPRCGYAELADQLCSDATQVGVISVDNSGGLNHFPLYNLVPPDGAPAALGFVIAKIATVLQATVRSDGDYGVRVYAANAPQAVPIIGAEVTVWGDPSSSAHDKERGSCLSNGPDDPGDPDDLCPSTFPSTAFLTNPTSCTAPGVGVETRVAASSWLEPANFHTASSFSHLAPPDEAIQQGIEGCEQVPFAGSIEVEPTTTRADSPTGLEVELSIPQSDDRLGLATSHLEDAVFTLPEGLTINPAAAGGLAGCSLAQFGLHDEAPPACPDASKVGTLEVETPLLDDPLTGAVYQAAQGENEFGSNLALYLWVHGGGVSVKLAGRVASDPETGRLTTTFLDNPQLPFERLRMILRGGQRSLLRTPPSCGTYSSQAALAPWARPGEEIVVSDSFRVDAGPGGGACPDGRFAPRLEAGSTNPVAGRHSPFVFEVSREDGTGELSTIEASLPPGLLARLAGVPYCPEAVLASIGTTPGAGVAERLAPSCPAASLVGHSDAAAGVGSLPFHNPGNVYLTGPYKGAPLGIAVVTPAVAGPLDLGSIVVRAALHVDPVTAMVRVVSDPIPHALLAGGDGFPLALQSVYVAIDRPRFTVNPTGCSGRSVDALFRSRGGATATASVPFAVTDCAALGFRPSLALRLKGATERAGFPALRATLRMPKGNANVARAAVALPRSVFLAQQHIGTVCTRVQYAAEACPARSVYGHARAFSPLLDEPLEGPVYLRSSSNPLPDLVAGLDGQVEIDLVGRIDSKNGGIRTTFAAVPDAPVSKFVLTMKGGRKGLLENSRDLCHAAGRAEVRMEAHNGRTRDFRPFLRPRCR